MLEETKAWSGAPSVDSAEPDRAARQSEEQSTGPSPRRPWTEQLADGFIG